MNTSYIRALEKRAEWLKSTREQAPASIEKLNASACYRKNLEEGEMFIMNKRFCELVDLARLDLPDDTKFELSWPPTLKGWMWLEQPFMGPKWNLDEEYRKKYLDGENVDVPVFISAVGWMPATDVKDLNDGHRYGALALPSDPVTGYMFMTYFDLGPSFEKWSYFTFKKDDEVGPKMRKFEEYAEKEGGRYVPESMNHHEIRWIYAAMHIMSQKLSIHVEHDTDRATKRRAEREKKTVASKFKVVTLRRLYHAQQAEKFKTEQEEREWNWQWTVRGHWRNQWFPTEKVHKQVFIESYIKGPEDKPMKPNVQKIFAAKR